MPRQIPLTSASITSVKNGYLITPDTSEYPLSDIQVFESFETLINWLESNLQHSGTDAVRLPDITQE